MGLPGPRGRPLATHKISIGEYKGEEGKGGHPKSQDYFTIRYHSVDRDRWLVNEKLQQRLVEWNEAQGYDNPDQPRHVPVLSPYTEIGEAVFTELATWAKGSRYICHCREFAVKTAETCREEGLDWPPRDGFPNAGDEYYCGSAQRWFWADNSDGYKVLDHHEYLTCNPATCPFRTGEWNKEARLLYKDIHNRWPSKEVVEKSLRLCKPHCVVPLIFPLVDNESPRAMFTTPSWHTSKALLRTYEELHGQCGGMIHCVELQLVMKRKRMHTPAGMQWNWIVEFEPLVPWRDLPALGAGKAKELAGSVEAQRQVRAHVKMLSGIVEQNVEEYGTAFLREHAIETGEEAPFIGEAQRRLYELGERCGWTQAELDTFFEGASDTEIYDQIGAFEEQLGIKQAKTPDAKPLDLAPDDPNEDPFYDSPQSKRAAAEKATAEKPKPNGKKSGEKKDSKKGKQETLIPDD